MPAVHPFHAVQFKAGSGDVSTLVAPPYDVLDLDGKNRLLHADASNIVAIDLPHVPAKELGPPETYAAAGDRFQSQLSAGILTRRKTPAMFAYRQTFTFSGKTHQRLGMACTIDTVPFGPRAGGGILPHEETFSGPKEDRFALMKATRSQLSPIFGLHADDHGRAVALLRQIMSAGRPHMTATTKDGVLHEVWTVDDPRTIQAYADALAGEDIFIADGHHRYTTAINYLKSLEAEGKAGPDHPARKCMIVLVGMSDPGLVIGPTHRVLGGMSAYTIDSFLSAARPHFELTEGPTHLQEIEKAMEAAAQKSGGRNVLGLIDFKTHTSFVATLKAADPLEHDFADKPREWRTLDVALIQHLVVKKICEPILNGGQPVKWAFPHSVDEVLDIGKGRETGAGGGSGFAQLAVVVRPTPLSAVRAVSKANQLMPQKSTFFYPKLATGLFINQVS
ncbi:MAG TPA: DUF1015 domain-containing protein [Phycisphaerales bacterium]|nr:DUF1015 domain-containing protein [Phycisphaerales bacterium]